MGTVLTSISIYLPLSPFIFFLYITDPAPIPAPAWVGNRGCATVSKQTLPFRGGEAKFASEGNAVISNEGL